MNRIFAKVELIGEQSIGCYTAIMARVMELYEALRKAETEEDRAHVIAHAFEELEERFPNLTDMATNASLRETELRLMKEIEGVRKEIADVCKEIEGVRKEIADVRKETATISAALRETELRLMKEIADVRIASLRHAMATVALLAGFITLLKLFT